MNSTPEPHFYGGQAVMEGVMMRGKTSYAMAVRRPCGEVEIRTYPIKKNTRKWLKLPVIRGVTAFVSSIKIGMKTLTESAEIASEGEAEEQTSRFERFLLEKFGDKFNDILIQFSVVLAILIAVSLFIVLPLWIGSLIPGPPNVIEGTARLFIFFIYILLISRLKDIRRVFEFHGAEHKTINGHENGAELNVESIRSFSRLHNRCGTSFLLIVMVISVLIFAFVQTPYIWLRFVSRLLLLPVVAGISFEVIRWAGRSKSPLVKIVSFPGLCLQKLTTGEPDDSQIEVAITALKTVLENEAEEAQGSESIAEKTVPADENGNIIAEDSAMDGEHDV